MSTVETLHRAISKKLDILEQFGTYLHYVLVHYMAILDHEKDKLSINRTTKCLSKIKPLAFDVVRTANNFSDLSTVYLSEFHQAGSKMNDVTNKIAIKFESALVSKRIIIQLDKFMTDLDTVSTEMSRLIKPIMQLVNEVQMAPLLVTMLMPTVEVVNKPVQKITPVVEVYDDFQELGEIFPGDEDNEQVPVSKPDVNSPVYLRWFVETHTDLAQAQMAIPSLQVNLHKFLRWTVSETIRQFQKGFKDVLIPVITPTVDNDAPDLCPECNEPLQMNTVRSEWCCENDVCGYVVRVDGVIFDDIQMHNQTGSGGGKHKNYIPGGHCDKRLNQIQAEDNTEIPAALILAVNILARKAYTRDGVLRDMSNMPCDEVRKWLKDLKQTHPELGSTEYNDHVALIRKLVTEKNGHSVVPPKFTAEEKNQIMALFQGAMEVYETLKQEGVILQESSSKGKKAKNKPFYHYVILQILLMLFVNDSRLPKWVQCIHLQRNTTLARHDENWQKICKRDNRFKYKPTDPALLRAMS